MPTDIEPVNGLPAPKDGNQLPGGFPDHIKERAIELVLISGSVAQAHDQLIAELVDSGMPCPNYKTLWAWARHNQDVIDHLRPERKAEMVAMASDAAAGATERMLEALPKLSDSQIPVAYGIAMQRRTDWESAGSKGNQLNVQFNLTSGGKPIKQGDGGA